VFVWPLPAEPVNNRIQVVKGRTVALEATLSCEVEIPFDTAAVTFTLKERISDDDASALWRGTIGDGIERDAEEEGRYVIKVPAEVSAELEADGVYFWDLVLKDGDDEWELDSGSFEVRAPVSVAV
jgi:hypothetical protein